MKAGSCVRLFSSLALAALLLPAACSQSGPSAGQGGSSGGSSSGGATSSGGVTSSGGTSASGGSSASGGTTTSGGTTGSGGSTSSGGSQASGGSGAGGSATGGTSTTGGSKSGGTTGTGTGGQASGGVTGSGGTTTSSGGATGGKTGTGGITGDGGGPATGGTGGGGSTGTCPTIDFGTWTSGKDPTSVGKLGTSYFMKNQLQAGIDNYGGDGYAWTFGYVGSLQFTQTTGDTANNKTMIGKLNCSTFQAPTGTDVDQRAFGDLPLEIFLENGDTACKTLGLGLADAQWKSTTSDGITTEARYWIDDMYMITGLQVWAYRTTKDQKYLDRAAKTMVAYINALQKDNDTKTTGLFWHTKQSKAYWGRANGWFASGATELLLELPAGHANREAIMTAWKKQMDALVGLQITATGADAGCWRQVLDRSDAWAESSCSAMFTFALATGLKNGWLTGDKYVTAAANGWKCIASKTDSAGLLTKVCEGTGQPTATDLAGQQSYYLGRGTPAGDRHGQGPLLWAANALLRTDCPGVR